ncbi:MAG: lytic transglycosylase domain-containing protein [Caulobacteraceae bacterium]|nr:lytic transglycosylase domain-containing protein [Caulobacteraceae bacterium]
MAALRFVLAAALATATPTLASAQGLEPRPAMAQAVERWRPFIAEAARRFAIPAAWIAAVMQAESAGFTTWRGQPITSRAGAMGLMQVMPDTYAMMRAQHHLGPDPYDPHDNILAGAAFLRTMYARFGYPGLFAAYNAGPVRYAAYLDGGAPLPGETRAYIASLAQAPASPAMPPAVPSGTRLFVTLGGASRSLQAVSGAAPRVAENALPDASIAPLGPAPLPRAGGLFIRLSTVSSPSW